jgi:lipoyl-dependent peroxiredoxin subunit D
LRAVEAAATAILTPEAVTAAKAASAIMGMNNIYYRALHLMESEDYATLRTSLRMNILANPGIDKADFELWALAVSAINGCGACLDSHEKVLREHGFSTTQIQNGIRIAAVISAIADVMRAESAQRA